MKFSKDSQILLMTHVGPQNAKLQLIVLKNIIH